MQPCTDNNNNSISKAFFYVEGFIRQKYGDNDVTTVLHVGLEFVDCV